MKQLLLSKLPALFAALAAEQKLYIPADDAAGQANFTLWREGLQLTKKLNTVRSAKDLFFPQVENLVGFRVAGKQLDLVETRDPAEPFVLFGVRACDARSFAILDRVFLSEPQDTYYAARRAHGTVVTLACTRPEETCFCQAFGVDPAQPQGDVSCWMDAAALYWQANTEKGEALTAKLSMLEDAGDEAVKAQQAQTRAILKKLPLASLDLSAVGAGKTKAEAEKEKMRGNLLRAVSHDIRTPLTAIVGGIDAILENGEKLSPETRTSLLENMRDESNWLIGVVENLLSVTRMSGASNIKKELEAGEEVLSAAAMKFQRHYPATRVEISAPDTLLMIPMDIILIEQVLINLMENAVQHGKTTTQISLRLTRSEDLAVFEVSDDGQGIAPALLPHLFDGYLTRDQEAISDKRRNMGIGLSVCKSIVQAHGGAMRASNRPTGGALLQFTLPLEETSHEDQRENTSD